MSYFNKELNDIGFKLYEPCEELKPYIFNYWSIEGSIEKEHSSKVLSDGSLGFVINFSNSFEVTINSKTTLCDSKVTLMGQTKYPTIMKLSEKLDSIGIRFNVGAAYKFFDEEISSFCNKNIAYDESFWDFESLYTKLLDIKNNEQRVKLIEDFLLKRLALAKKKNSIHTFDIINYIIEQKGDISVEDLSENFNISVRQIERIFKKEVGLTVKLYIRIVRLRNVRDSISSLEVDTLTNTAYENGFFDQAHFIKEFKVFMCETPKSYYLNKLTMAKKFNFKKYKN